MYSPGLVPSALNLTSMYCIITTIWLSKHFICQAKHVVIYICVQESRLGHCGLRRFHILSNKLSVLQVELDKSVLRVKF